ncbi:MAG TPA: DUF364 domain-containing protein [Geobacteraceae bacterium]|nr:DUF364 domain-containing protein [Geobacteraceae bacterium]
MKLVDALLESVSGKDYAIEGCLVGLHWTCVTSSGTGMAHTLRGREGAELEDAGNIAGRDVLEIASRLRSWEQLDACLGLAALCSLIEPAGDRVNVVDFLLNTAPGKTVTCIGRFPFYPEILKTAKRAFLLEMNPVGDELPSFAAEEVVPESDLVILTATTLINKSMERLLELSRKGITVILGPSTPMSDVLFDFGADVLAGIRVVNSGRLFESVSQGVKLYHKIGGIESVTRFRK